MKEIKKLEKDKKGINYSLMYRKNYVWRLCLLSEDFEINILALLCLISTFGKELIIRKMRKVEINQELINEESERMRMTIGDKKRMSTKQRKTK